jgi:hypothetical protein
MKILVAGVSPGTTQAVVACTSSAEFLVHAVTKGGGDYAISVKSTGLGFGISLPTFVVGGIAHDTVSVIFQPGTDCFLTLQTEDAAHAGITIT